MQQKIPEQKEMNVVSRREQRWRGAAKDQPPAGVYSLLFMAHTAATSHGVPVACTVPPFSLDSCLTDPIPI